MIRILWWMIFLINEASFIHFTWYGKITITWYCLWHLWKHDVGAFVIFKSLGNVYILNYLNAKSITYAFLIISLSNQLSMNSLLLHCQINYLWIFNYFIAKSIIYEILIISLPNTLNEVIVNVFIEEKFKAEIKDNYLTIWSAKLIYSKPNLKLLLEYLMFEFYKC